MVLKVKRLLELGLTARRVGEVLANVLHHTFKALFQVFKLLRTLDLPSCDVADCRARDVKLAIVEQLAECAAFREVVEALFEDIKFNFLLLIVALILGDLLHKRLHRQRVALQRSCSGVL